MIRPLILLLRSLRTVTSCVVWRSSLHFWAAHLCWSLQTYLVVCLGTTCTKQTCGNHSSRARAERLCFLCGFSAKTIRHSTLKNLQSYTRALNETKERRKAERAVTNTVLLELFLVNNINNCNLLMYYRLPAASSSCNLIAIYNYHKRQCIYNNCTKQ